LSWLKIASIVFTQRKGDRSEGDVSRGDVHQMGDDEWKRVDVKGGGGARNK